jgi:hypothetical protein
MTTQEIGMTSKEFESFSINNRTLSDMDYSYNPKSGEYDVPALECSDYMGEFSVSYSSEEARSEALNEYEQDMVSFTLKARIEAEEARKAKIVETRRIKNLKSLGGQFPELLSLIN